LPDLLEAIGYLAEDPSAPNVHLLVVGTGELEATARERVASAGLPVTFAGFLNQSAIPEAYVAADCLALPSDCGETWGLVVNEAMACGLPAVVSDRVGCGPDLVEPGVTGALFPCGDTTALAETLGRLCGDPAALMRMGEAARQRVVERYSIAAAVAGTLEAVHALVGDD